MRGLFHFAALKVRRPARLGYNWRQQEGAHVMAQNEDRPAKAAVWLLAARPKTLPAAAAPVLMGTAMAWEAGGVHLPSALCALAAAALIQVGTNYANDYFDFAKGTDTVKRVGPTRATQAGLVAPRQMKYATALVFGLAFLLGLYLAWRGGWPILLIGVLSILFGVLYTAGPLPLGYIGAADLFVLVFFGPVAVAGTYYVQKLDFAWPPVVAGLAPGLLSVALLTANNLRDVDTDREAGKKTLAVRFGKGFARAEYALCLLGGLAVMPVVLTAALGGPGPVLAASALALPALIPLRTVLRTSEPEALIGALGATGKLLLLFSIVFSVGWLL